MMTRGYPSPFRPDKAQKYLKEENPEDLNHAFHWHQTPQGQKYWEEVYYGGKKFGDEQRKIIEGWLDAYDKANPKVTSSPPVEHNVFDPKNWGV